MRWYEYYVGMDMGDGAKDRGEGRGSKLGSRSENGVASPEFPGSGAGGERWPDRRKTPSAALLRGTYSPPMLKSIPCGAENSQNDGLSSFDAEIGLG